MFDACVILFFRGNKVQKSVKSMKRKEDSYFKKSLNAASKHMALGKGTHPDRRSTSYPDKSQEAAVLDDRLSRCPPRRRLPTTRSREGNVALHLTLQPINTARSADAHMQAAADVRMFHLKPILPSLLSRGGWTDLWMPAPSACFTLSQRQGAKFTSFWKRSLTHVYTERNRGKVSESSNSSYHEHCIQREDKQTNPKLYYHFQSD